MPPFTVKNTSGVFAIEEARFTCFLNAALFKIGDEKGWTMARVAPARPGSWWKKSEQAAVEIPHGKIINYSCGPDEMFRDVRLKDQPAFLRGMQVQISIDYAANLPFYVWHRHYDSDVFTCDVSSGNCRWFIGEFVR